MKVKFNYIKTRGWGRLFIMTSQVEDCNFPRLTNEFPISEVKTLLKFLPPSNIEFIELLPPTKYIILD